MGKSPDTWSLVCVIEARVPENASVTILNGLMLPGRSISFEWTICPSAPQSISVGVCRSVTTLVVLMSSRGCCGGFRWSGVLALNENVGDRLE